MNYPYWEYNDSKKEITIYYSDYRYCTYYDEDAEGLYKDLELGTERERQFILNEIYLDMERSDPYRRSNDLI